jgi:hypothetical protein
VVTTAVLPLLPEEPRYPILGAYPKYGDFTILAVAVSRFELVSWYKDKNITKTISALILD